MKLKKILLLIIIGIFCFIPVVKAEDDIVVKSVKLVDATDGVISKSTNKVDLEFNDLGQVAKYEVTLKNNTNKSLYANSLVIDGSSQNFMKYTLDDESRSKTIKPDSKEKITIIVNTANEKGAGRNLSDTISFKLQLNDKIVNPNTSSNLITIILLVIVGAIAITIVMTKFNNKKGTIATVIVCFMLLGTSFVFADDTVMVEFTGQVSYTSQNLLEISGTAIENHKANYTNSKDIWLYSDKVKNINIITDNSVIEKYAYTFDLTINDRQRVKAYLVENGNSEAPYDLTIVSNGVIYAPEDATGLFSFPNVETINGLENIMFDNTVKMTGMFIGNEKLSTMDMSTLDTSSVKDTSYMFHKCLSLDVDQSKFNLENIEVRNNMFVQYLKDVVVKDAQSDKNIDFGNTSSSTNGEGVYLRSGTENDKNPVYYYRGAVTNNNVKFAGFCWKMVRTTETGGVKLVYNGIPNSSGYCNNSGTASQIGTVKFNTTYFTPTYGGYMYDSTYALSSKASSSLISGLIYGNDVEYKDGKYTLVDIYKSTSTWTNTYNKVSPKYHYTCFNNEDSCQSVNYIYYVDSSTAYYITLSNGKKVDAALDTMLAKSSNSTDSNMKVMVDAWYQNNLINYTSYLENTVWCSDRSIAQLNGWDKDNEATGYLNFGSYDRVVNTVSPNLACSNQNDSFTLSTDAGGNKNYGNNKLIYPVGLLTADEALLAGAKWGTENRSFYLYTGENWWTMSPIFFKPGLGSMFAINSLGNLSDRTSVNLIGVRPAISLKSGIDYVSGTGTIANPYVIE